MIFLLGLFIGGIVGLIATAIFTASGRGDLDMKVFEIERELWECRKNNAKLKNELKKRESSDDSDDPIYEML